MEKYKKLLERILEIQSKTGQEKRMKKFVRSYIRNELGLKVTNDQKGNLYCNKGDMRKGRPFILAHLDTVHQVNKNVKSFFNGEFYFAFDMKTMKQYGVGGDDKVGIWGALSALTNFDNISVAFFVEEEVGCVGSNRAPLERFAKANWMAQLDRRDNIDFITASMASKEFLNDMTPIAESFELVQTSQSTTTDVSTLHRRGVGVSGVNIGSGYYFPHSSQEVIVLEDANNALSLLFKMISEKGGVKYPHTLPKPKPIVKQIKHIGFGDPARNINNDTGYNNIGYNNARYNNDAVYVGNLIRIWNTFYGCFEWRDYFGNLLYYEGTGLKARHFCKKPDNLKSSKMIAPKDQCPLPKTIKEEAQIEFEEFQDKGDRATQTNDEYWDDLAERTANQQMISDAEDAAAKEETSIKTYHQHGCDTDLKYAESQQARKQIDNALFLYSYSFQEFTDGLIPDEIIKNISATLHYDHGHTVLYYEKIFGIEGMYESADHLGSWGSFEKKSELPPF